MNHDRRSRHRISVIALLGVVSLYAAAAVGAPPQPRERRRARRLRILRAVAVLVAGILPVLPGNAECNGPRRYGFIVHGLWPQNETGWPEHCDVHRAVPDDVAQGIGDLMPARGLVYHEWSAHGTCSGLEPAEYFALVRRAFSSVAIPRELSNPTQAIEQPPAAVAAAFLHANPRLGRQSVVITCSGQGSPRLREVRVCLDRDLAPRACSADALHEACRAPQVIIPPIH